MIRTINNQVEQRGHEGHSVVGGHNLIGASYIQTYKDENKNQQSSGSSSVGLKTVLRGLDILGAKS